MTYSKWTQSKFLKFSSKLRMVTEQLFPSTSICSPNRLSRFGMQISNTTEGVDASLFGRKSVLGASLTTKPSKIIESN